MSDYTYSDRAVEAWRKVLRARLRMWEAIQHLEEIIGMAIDHPSDLDTFAAKHYRPGDIDAASSEDLEVFFGPRLPEDAEVRQEGYVYKPDIKNLEEFK